MENVFPWFRVIIKMKEATSLNFIWDLARATKTNRGIILLEELRLDIR